MAALTGRTQSKYIRFVIGDTSNVLREVPILTLGDVGLTAPEVDLRAIQDAVAGFLSGQPDFELEFSGPFDTIAAASVAASGAAPVLSGSHTVLQTLYLGNTPRSFGIYIGMRAYWEDGAPTFGVSRSATSGCLVTKYNVKQNGEAMEYTARIRMFPGSTAPAWGTSAVT